MSWQALQIKTQIEIKKKKSCGGKYSDWISSDNQTQWLQKSGSVLPGAAGPGESQRGGNPGRWGRKERRVFQQHRAFKGNGLEVRCAGVHAPQRVSAFTGSALQESTLTPASCSYYFKRTMSRKVSIFKKVDARR